MAGKPKPTHLKLVTGNPGKRALPKGEPKPRGRLKDPPDWFSDTQRAGWTYAIEHAPPGLLKRLDRGVLTVWVVAEDLHRQASLQLQSSSLLVRATPQSTAAPIQNPYLAILNRQAVLMLKAASELGFSPAARPRIEVDPREVVRPEEAEAEEDDFDL